jgi:catechol 2,3-dioxygenase-like lactoylglutathione lyase family enzyme
MDVIPVLKCVDLRKSLVFYTTVLDFEAKYPEHLEDSIDNGVIDLIHQNAEIQLSRHPGDGVSGCATNIRLNNLADVDLYFARYVQRGLDIYSRKDSPAHQAPYNQSWGMREFYATDPDENTLRIGYPLP